MNVLIREYCSNDFQGLIKLLDEVYGSKIDQKTLEDNYISKYRNILIATTSLELIVGCAFVEVQEDLIRPRRIIYVTYVAVDERYRGLGIGKQIMTGVKDICEKKHCSAIELTSANYRTKAHLFYEALGFDKKQTTLFIKEIKEG